MKTILIAFTALLTATGMASAQSANRSASDSQSYSSVNIQNHGSRNAASAIAPGGAAGPYDCRVVGGIGGAWSAAGLSLGIPIEGRKCNVRLDAQSMLNTTGSRNAAKQRLCMDRDMRKAFATAGEYCANDSARAYKAKLSTKRGKAKSKASTKTASTNVKLLTCLKRADRSPDIDPRACHRAYGG